MQTRDDEQSLVTNPALLQYMKENNITPMQTVNQRGDQDWYTMQAAKDGKLIGDPHTWQDQTDHAFWNMAMAMAAVTGANVAGAGAAGAQGAANAETPTGMDLAGDAAAGTGNNISYAGGQLGGDAASSAGGLANTGSDAHFYQPQSGGLGVQDLGNMGGIGTSTIPTLNLGGASSIGSLLKDAGKFLGNKNGTGAASGNNLQMLFGGGGLSDGDRYRQQLLMQSLRDNADKSQGQQMPGWIPGS
jgi:hypothetical protein